ncbi:MAG: FAD-binding protein [Alphaproteobacteria bacterium]|nr:FAD-binding protein [Alphaproteobacteria bacterium]
MLLADHLAERLRRETSAEVLFTRADRGRYATDASIYQVMPIGVVVPRSTDDVVAAMAVARAEGVPVLARGGGTSQCGQTVNRALVIDFSKHLNRVLHVDPAARTARVEPGIVLNTLNAALASAQLFFPVDPSTHSRCTIGGMAGNNSCGAKSIRYGLMADNVRAIEALLADGTQHRFSVGQNEAAPRITELTARLLALGEAEAAEIAVRFPHVLRRVGGYNIDTLVPARRPLNLARLLVGSEGTLALSTAIELFLHPIRPRKVVGICQFPTFRAAMQATAHLVALDPDAVELVDRTMIELGRGIPIYRPTIEEMLIGEPDSLLIVEFHGEEDAALAARLNALEQAMGDLGYPNAVVRATDAAFQARIAQVREAGLNIMMSMKGDAKPVSFIEDCAVPLADLADYTARLEEVFARHGVRGTWYAHASVGCLHVRPVLNTKDPDDLATMRAVAEECFALVREYKGSHSGEHGDGIVRSEFHAAMFGERLVRAFETVKDAFDPAGLLNPNRIVHPPRMDDRTLLRYPPGYARAPGSVERLDWSAHPNGLLGAAEMCNNNGTCRAFNTGSMCPSFRATRDEQHGVRGRANTLRLALSGQLDAKGIAGADVKDALRFCVGCKACRRECPTGVDMARMKIEATAARAAAHGVALRERLIAALPRLARVAAIAPGLANLPAQMGLLRHLGLARTPPPFRGDVFADREADGGAGDGAPVLLFADTFNRYFEPENLRAAVRVLHAAGVRPSVPRARGRPLCCGRTFLAAGMIDRARREMRRTLAALAGDAPVVGLEPSCLFTLKDELPSLLPGAAARALADRVMLLAEFLADDKRICFTPRAAAAHVHGHCHQKSFGAFPATLALLQKVPGLSVRPITSSCCGMAGAFGYQTETQAVSQAMAELSLLPAVRAAAPDDLIVADGTSCRAQIADLSGRRAVHSVQVLAAALTTA